MKRSGRPMKYSEFIVALEDTKLYGASTIVKNAEEKGFFDRAEFQGPDARLNARMAMNRLSSKRLPDQGDGFIQEPNLPTIKAWYGWRWKAAIPARYLDDSVLRQLEYYRARERPPAKTPPTEKIRIPLPSLFKKSWISLILLIVTAFSLGAVMTVYSEGIQVLHRQGPKAALDFFRNRNQKVKDFKAEFGQAWSKYVLGNLAEAEKDCRELLLYQDLPQAVLGNCYYLLGHIQLRTGLYEEARDSLETAFDTYQRLNKWDNQYKTLVAFSSLALETGNLGEAEAFIEEAAEFNETLDNNKGQLFLLRAKLEFLRGNHFAALAHSREGFTAFEEVDRFGDQADALSDMGFYAMLLGRYDEGYGHTMNAQEIIQKTGNDLKYYFNMVNLLLYQKCKNGPVTPMETQILQRIEREGEHNLLFYLDYVADWECAPDLETLQEYPSPPGRVGASTGDPPDGD